MPVEAATQFRARGGERQLCRPTESPDHNVGGKGFRGWPTVAVLALVVALAVGSATTGLFFWLNEQEALFRDNPGVLSPGTLLTFLLQADRLGMLLLPLGGWIVDRYGPRRVLLIAIPVVGLGGILAGTGPLAAAVAGLLTVGVIRGVGVRLPTAAVANHWFRRRRAIAIAVLQFAASVAGLTVSLVRDSVGRPPVIVLGVLVLVIGFPIAWAIRNRPEDTGQVPDRRPIASGSVPEPDYGWRDAVRGRTFWLFVLAAVALDVVRWTGTTLLPELLADRVVDANAAYGRIFTTRQMVAAGFLLVGGVVAERASTRHALQLFALVHVVAIAALLTADSLTSFFVASALFAAGGGGMAAANVAVLGEYFGRRQFATLLGTSSLCIGMLSQWGTSLVALLLDATDDRVMVITAAAVLALVAVTAYHAVGNPRPDSSPRATAEGSASC